MGGILLFFRMHRPSSVTINADARRDERALPARAAHTEDIGHEATVNWVAATRAVQLQGMWNCFGIVVLKCLQRTTHN